MRLERVQKDQVGVRRGDLRDDAPRHRALLLAAGERAREVQPVVVVAHAKRERDARVGKRLQRRRRKAEVLDPAARRREVAEHHRVRWERTKRKNLLYQLRQNLVRLRRAVLPPHRVVVLVDVRKEHHQIGIVRGIGAIRCVRTGRNGLCPVHGSDNARPSHSYSAHPGQKDSSCQFLHVICPTYCRGHAPCQRRKIVMLWGGGLSVKMWLSMFAHPLTYFQAKVFHPATMAVSGISTRVGSVPFPPPP